MPLNFGLLQPVDIGARFMAGQEEAQRNQLAQQQRAQDQELNALRMQQTRGAISQQERQLKAETAAQKTEMFRQRLLRAPDPNSARELVKMQYADPDVGAVLSQAGSLEQALAEVPDDPEQFERYRQQEAMGMSEWIKSQMPKVTPAGDVYDPAKREFIRKPQAVPTPKEFTPPASVLEFERAQQDPAFMNFLRQRAEAGRAPSVGGGSKGGGARVALPKAPQGYRYTATGDLEPIPGGPVAAKQDEAQNKREAGRAQATDILDSLGDAYGELNRMKAIPSEQRNVLSNLLSSVSASQAGQLVGRAAGTEAQTQRDVASSSRLQLFAAIKNATGLSSQQLNSNVEFTTWLNSLTDPSRSIETNTAILENMRKFIASGGTYSAKKGGDKTPTSGVSNITQERADANAAIAAGAPPAAVRQRFKQKTGQEL